MYQMIVNINTNTLVQPVNTKLTFDEIFLKCSQTERNYPTIEEQISVPNYWNTTPPTALVVIQSLIDSPYDFYLGGSRLKALQRPENGANVNPVSVTADTDYDFYATYTEDVVSYLIANGFDLTDFCKSLDEDGYELDNEAVVIYVCGDIQVVLRRDAKFYQRVFDSIDLGFYYNHIWKSSPACPDRPAIKSIMNALFDAAHSTQQ